MAGEALGPLHGVPIAIKDFTPTAGKTTTRGSYAFEHWVPERDALIVERLRAAGAIMLGKTTTPEFAYSSFTHSPLWGITRNPWDLSRERRAARPAALARRWPQAACRSPKAPTWAARCASRRLGAASSASNRALGGFPWTFLPTVFDSISHFGPLARTVADAALFFGVAQGPGRLRYPEPQAGAGRSGATARQGRGPAAGPQRRSRLLSPSIRRSRPTPAPPQRPSRAPAPRWKRWS